MDAVSIPGATAGVIPTPATPTTRGLPASGTARAVLLIGPVAAGLAILASLLGQVPSSTPEVPAWALVAAIIALAVGIPHGAVDHLMLPALPRGAKLLGLAAIYLAIAAVATLAILIAPGPAFVIVVAMTVWHFGSGDVEAWATLTGEQVHPRGWHKALLAIAAGGAPVVLPLTSPAAMTTLATVHPSLGAWWSAPATTYVRIAILAAVVVSIIMLLHTGRPIAAVHLGILAALGIFAAPLLAFAVYFGAWHALRHTARLAEHRYGTITWAGIGRITLMGTPALIGTIVIVAIAVAVTGSLTALAPWLFVGLAVVWGLTVPHMSLVEYFDRRASRE
jgi:Brp/Blh family beta-carotene 15,15'-monooxygenase